MFRKLREPVNGLTHFFTAIAAIIGLIALLVIGWGNIGNTISLAVYGISLLLFFSASATYHLVRARLQIVEILRKFDHAAIYLLIDGSYTQIYYNMFTGFWKWGMLIIVRAVALTGIGIKMQIMRSENHTWWYGTIGIPC